MNDWEYCEQALPKVSRTFALNICVLEGDLKNSILVAYLFCRIVDTVEDAADLDANIKVRLLEEFSRIIQDPEVRASSLSKWVGDCCAVDGTENDLDLLSNTEAVFRAFDTLPKNHQEQIIPSVSEMALGMAYFQQKFDSSGLTLLESQEELEEYCFFVAGLVGEMLCNLFFQALPNLPPASKKTMRETAVSFGLGLQMTNISKDMIVDRSRGWSYIPRAYISEAGLTVEAFSDGGEEDKSLKVLSRILNKTMGHLEDALRFTLAIPSSATRIRLFCIWPLWMAMETVAVLHNNKALLKSDDPVKITRKTVRRILRRTRLICFSDLLLKWSFGGIQKRAQLENPPRFDLNALKSRLKILGLGSPQSADKEAQYG
ncbi:MAG: squalene/phytoene synthase family protein [Candidatus Nitronauta litoralis]|uniref:Squalene/phytoene synthase family protein n=1 Tax=Candidatus Nitronauta litoralis TaxID=2705533 RepID=A0A7T0BTE2_9BACT|nr:MAG: squalene/phytoene synthase family protein [Candidatus Nitronauta litoralis]